MLDLAVVTTVRNYGRFLPEWAASILALSLKPALVVLVEQGSTDDSWAQVERAAAQLMAGGLRVRVQRMPATDFGTARNAAVSLTDTEWVMHLDADDMLMPHALADAAVLAPACDVVQLGYERCGDLAAGPPNRRKPYRSGLAHEILASPTPCSGCSPFRRALWERAPYVTDQTGGWDTALWLGFAHLGARFRATARPCFWYRQHADSVFNRRRTERTYEAALVGHQLQSRRRGDAGVSVVVPVATFQDVTRARNWTWVAAHLAATYPTWQVVEGPASGGPLWWAN